MQDISKLIAEAKPLYFARKKRKQRMAAWGVTMACVALLWVTVPQKTSADNSYIWDVDDTESEVASYVENLGLPVDDYGLLLVG
jgi:hypothetical protein